MDIFRSVLKLPLLTEVLFRTLLSFVRGRERRYPLLLRSALFPVLGGPYSLVLLPPAETFPGSDRMSFPFQEVGQPHPSRERCTARVVPRVVQRCRTKKDPAPGSGSELKEGFRDPRAGAFVQPF